MGSKNELNDLSQCFQVFRSQSIYKYLVNLKIKNRPRLLNRCHYFFFQGHVSAVAVRQI